MKHLGCSWDVKYSDSDASPIVSPKSLVPTHFNSPKIYQRVPVNIMKHGSSMGKRMAIDLSMAPRFIVVYHPIGCRIAVPQLRWSTTGKVSSMRTRLHLLPRECAAPLVHHSADHRRGAHGRRQPGNRGADPLRGGCWWDVDGMMAGKLPRAEKKTHETCGDVGRGWGWWIHVNPTWLDWNRIHFFRWPRWPFLGRFLTPNKNIWGSGWGSRCRWPKIPCCPWSYTTSAQISRPPWLRRTGFYGSGRSVCPLGWTPFWWMISPTTRSFFPEKK